MGSILGLDDHLVDLLRLFFGNSLENSASLELIDEADHVESKRLFPGHFAHFEVFFERVFCNLIDGEFLEDVLGVEDEMECLLGDITEAIFMEEVEDLLLGLGGVAEQDGEHLLALDA